MPRPLTFRGARRTFAQAGDTVHAGGPRAGRRRPGVPAGRRNVFRGDRGVDARWPHRRSSSIPRRGASRLPPRWKERASTASWARRRPAHCGGACRNCAASRTPSSPAAGREHVRSAQPRACRCSRHSAACGGDSVALVSFTSGTTGRPKGVLRTHSVLVATQQTLARRTRTPRGRDAFVRIAVRGTRQPWGRVRPASSPTGNLTRPAQLDPARLGAQIRAHHVEVVVASPTVADRLATHASATGGF